jgi:7,8-dihydropterin-6-yl-methyl-4-(beta-D-ribofuranosyl)aminobenzene 5'-phosphate synthase
MGGFHRTPAPDSCTTQVIQALKEIDPDYLVPMHCNGAGFARGVQKEMPDKLIVPHTGTRFIFGG